MCSGSRNSASSPDLRLQPSVFNFSEADRPVDAEILQKHAQHNGPLFLACQNAVHKLDLLAQQVDSSHGEFMQPRSSLMPNVPVHGFHRADPSYRLFFIPVPSFSRSGSEPAELLGYWPHPALTAALRGAQPVHQHLPHVVVRCVDSRVVPLGGVGRVMEA